MESIEMIIPDGICDECLNCTYYWENQYDEYMNCDGEESPCHEYIEVKHQNCPLIECEEGE